MANILQQVLGWLRAGYPGGVPREDHVALFAVLHRRLTETEVRQVAEELARPDSDGTISKANIEAAISALAKEKPGADDVARVSARLAAGGWPLAKPVTTE